MADNRQMYRASNRGQRTGTAVRQPAVYQGTAQMPTTGVDPNVYASYVAQMMRAYPTTTPGMYRPGGTYNVYGVQGAEPQPPAAAEQAEALRGQGDIRWAFNWMEPKDQKAAQEAFRGGYIGGGFEGAANAMGPEWYDLPSSYRTALLSGVR